MILAQYTIRSKQDYIFKTNQVLEIVGASEHIAKIWDVLFEVAEEISLNFQRTDKEFNMDSIKKAMEESDDNRLNLVELFCGGGNVTILFDSDINAENNSFKSLNRAFSKKLLVDYPGIIAMVACVNVSGNYSEDYKNLRAEIERKKDIMEPQWDMFTVPFAMMDRNTFQPYSTTVMKDYKEVRLSDESYKKYVVGQKLRDKNKDVKLFDDLVTEKGKESLLAVVHIDGNNMGAKIMNMLHGVTDYDDAIKIMREFTNTTADCFEKSGDKALTNCKASLRNKYVNEREESLTYRKLIGSGDDMTFICNARYVMDYVEAYLNSVQNYQKDNNSKWKYSSCAGICIFHSHYPFSRAYSIAEQSCDDFAKKKVHAVIDGKPIEQGWVDFHYIHSGIGGNLEDIRDSQGTDKCLARPWLVAFDDDDVRAKKEVYKYSKLIELQELLQKYDVARTSIKTIGSAFERSESAAKKELTSLYGHTEGLEKEINSIYKEEIDFLKSLYDLSEIYDLWFREVK